MKITLARLKKIPSNKILKTWIEWLNNKKVSNYSARSSKKHSICLCFMKIFKTFKKHKFFENAIQNFQKVQKCSKNIENITNSSLFSPNRAFSRHLSPETRMDVKKPQILHGDDKLCMGLEPPPFFISYTIQMGLIRFEKVQKPFFSKCIRSK